MWSDVGAGDRAGRPPGAPAGAIRPACAALTRVDSRGAAMELDIPRLQMSSGLGEVVLGPVGPGDVLVVDGVVGEAAVEDADEAVAEGP